MEYQPVFATNDLGVRLQEASYLPFGGVHVATGGIDLHFPGQWFQAESGLHQNWMCDYDPTTGRYLQADPLGLVDGASVYGYVGQNPGRYIDPRGEFGVAGAVVGGLSNLGIQILVNYAKYCDLTTALRCVDIKDVMLSAGFGFLGASPLSAIKAGRYGSAGGIAVVTAWTKKITTPTPVRIGDECECDDGQGLKDGAVDLLKKLNL